MRTLLILAIALLFTSCEKILFEEDRASSDPFDNFDYLWNEVDKKYSYFELKNIDWDQIREVYRAKLPASTSEERLFEVLADMLKELRDDHVNLVSPFNISRYNLPLQHNENYRGRTVEQYYIPSAQITGAFVHDYLPGSQIGYIRYSSFMNDVTDDALEHILRRYSSARGLIIDLRKNGGGNLFNVPLILEKFTYGKTLAAYSITRNGPGRDDFGPREAFYIGTDDGSYFMRPVMVLIDRNSYSATSFFALLTKSLPNITLIGDTTGGGGGLPNGGQLPNGWTYRFSVSQLLDLDMNNYAEDGVPPDIYAEFDWSDLTKDEIIERAMEEIGVK